MSEDRAFSCESVTSHTPVSNTLNLFHSPQDDYRVCMDFSIIQKDSPPVCPVDASGCFTAEVTDFTGQYVKVCVCRTEKGVDFIIFLCLISFLLSSFISGFFSFPGNCFFFLIWLGFST